MALYWPTPGLKGRTFKLCVLTRWDFNFCVRSSPLRLAEAEEFALDSLKRGSQCRDSRRGETWSYLEGWKRRGRSFSSFFVFVFVFFEVCQWDEVQPEESYNSRAATEQTANEHSGRFHRQVFADGANSTKFQLDYLTGAGDMLFEKQSVVENDIKATDRWREVDDCIGYRHRLRV